MSQLLSSHARTSSAFHGLCERAFDLCVAKARRTIRVLADDPKSLAFAADGNYATWPEPFFDIGNWTSSFFTGMALLGFRRTGDKFLLDQALRLKPWYRRKVLEHAADTMHDLGFLYSLYAVALHRLTGEKEFSDMGLRAARELAARFVTPGDYLRAWGRMDDTASDYQGLAIIDCLMNLPLLFWAADQGGDARLREIAVRHADTTLHHFVRPDDSVFHAYRFDPRTGEPIGGDNYCGQAVNSQWARGTAWAIYGFAMAYRYTADKRYLDTAERLARRYLAKLDETLIPVWDFRLPPEMPRLRDSSAAAIAVCGLQELRRVGSIEPSFQAMATQTLARLCSEEYLDADPERLGVLRHGQVGDGVGFAKSAYTSWGDYYFMEALAGALGHGPTFW